MTIAELGRWPHVRHPRFPSNPKIQSGPRAKKISGMCLPLPCTPGVPGQEAVWGGRHGHAQVWPELATSCNLGEVATFSVGHWRDTDCIFRGKKSRVWGTRTVLPSIACPLLCCLMALVVIVAAHPTPF